MCVRSRDCLFVCVCFGWGVRGRMPAHTFTRKLPAGVSDILHIFGLKASVHVYLFSKFFAGFGLSGFRARSRAAFAPCSLKLDKTQEISGKVRHWALEPARLRRCARNRLSSLAQPRRGANVLLWISQSQKLKMMWMPRSKKFGIWEFEKVGHVEALSFETWTLCNL